MTPNHFAPPRLSLRLFAVWRRNFLVWRKLALPSIVGNLADQQWRIQNALDTLFGGY